jgi:hypothetical protein
MLQGLSEHLTKSVSRRNFLSRASSAAGAIALALLGVQPAYAYYDINGCHLCNNPATCSYSGCSCEWCWNGLPVDNGDGTFDHYRCYECYTAAVCPGAGSCPLIGVGSNGCNGWKCSKSVYVNTTGGGPCLGPDCPCGHKPC